VALLSGFLRLFSRTHFSSPPLCQVAQRND